MADDRGPKLAPLELTVIEREELQGLAWRPKTAQALALRARIVLAYAHTGWLCTVKAPIGERRNRNIATVAVTRKQFTLVFYGVRDGRIRAQTQARKAA